MWPALVIAYRGERELSRMVHRPYLANFYLLGHLHSSGMWFDVPYKWILRSHLVLSCILKNANLL